MNLADLVKELLSYSFENEWFEFKENMKTDHELGEYISALSNGAAYMGKEQGYLVWGIEDSTHKIVGTDFDPNCNTSHNEPLKHYLERLVSPHLKIDFEEVYIDSKRIVVLSIPSAKNIPTSWDGVRYIRVGSSKEKLSRFPVAKIWGCIKYSSSG